MLVLSQTSECGTLVVVVEKCSHGRWLASTSGAVFETCSPRGGKAARAGLGSSGEGNKSCLCARLATLDLKYRLLQFKLSAWKRLMDLAWNKTMFCPLGHIHCTLCFHSEQTHTRALSTLQHEDFCVLLGVYHRPASGAWKATSTCIHFRSPTVQHASVELMPWGPIHQTWLQVLHRLLQRPVAEKLLSFGQILESRREKVRWYS